MEQNISIALLYIQQLKEQKTKTTTIIILAIKTKNKINNTHKNTHS